MKKLNKFSINFRHGIDFTLLQDALIEVGEYKKESSSYFILKQHNRLGNL